MCTSFSAEFYNIARRSHTQSNKHTQCVLLLRIYATLPQQIMIIQRCLCKDGGHTHDL